MDDRRLEWLAEMLREDPEASWAIQVSAAWALAQARAAVERSRALRARLAEERAARGRRKGEPPAWP